MHSLYRRPPVVPSQSYSLRTPAATAQSRSVSSNGNNQVIDYGYNDLRQSRQNSSVTPHTSSLPQRRSYHGGNQTSFEPTTTSPSNYYPLPAASYSDPSVATLELHPSFSPMPTFSPSGLSAFDSTNSDPFSLIPSPFAYETQLHPFPSISGQNTVQQEHVLYYFEHVRKMQFIFASNSVTNITVSVSIW
jgi:hypothetical protein